MNNNVYTICYNKLDVFPDRKSAKKFYTECYYCSDGAEHSRYGSILIGLDTNNIAFDGVDNKCNMISVIDKDWNNNGSLEIKLDGYIPFTEAINYYECDIEPIIKLANIYGINFNSKNPFEDYGSDEESDYMCSFSKFYEELINDSKLIEKIETKEISDGKYEMSVFPSVGNKIIIDIRAWDKLDDVINNYITLKEELDKEIAKEI